MRVSTTVEFEVESDEELDEQTARQAAEAAVYHYIALTKDNVRVWKEAVTVHVDGYGKCKVKLA